MRSKPTMLRRLAFALTMTLAVAGCQSGPDLRVADSAMAAPSTTEGRRLLEEGRAVEAVSAFRRRLRQDGPDVQALNGLGIAYSELGRPDLAAEMFGRALALAPEDAATLNNIGFAALRRADAGLARRYLERARALQDDLDEVDGNLKGLAWLESLGGRSTSRPTLRLAALHAADSEAPTAIRLALPSVKNRRPSTIEGSVPPETKPSQPPNPDIIDFMSVIDPFNRNPRAE